MTIVYVAARFDQRERLAKEVAEPLIAAGHIVTSSWLRLGEDSLPLGAADIEDNLELAAKHGLACRADVHRAEAVAVFTDHSSSTGGYHVEVGLGMAWGQAAARRRTEAQYLPRTTGRHAPPGYSDLPGGMGLRRVALAAQKEPRASLRLPEVHS